MSYVPHTERERRDMLAAIGVARIADPFADVPAPVRFPELKLPPALAEQDLLRELHAQAACNFPSPPHVPSAAPTLTTTFDPRPPPPSHLAAPPTLAST